MKKSLYFALGLLMAIIFCLSGCDGYGDNVEQIDAHRTQLYVYNYDGGVGTEWLDRMKAEFEAEYADYEFEPGSGKKGVEIRIEPTKDSPSAAIASSNNEVYFAQSVNYNSLISQDLLLDITDMVQEIIPGEEKTIEDKMSATQVSALTALKDKHYVLPHYQVYSGISYDVDLFEQLYFYFDENGEWTNYRESYDEDPENNKLSPGPDGIKGTYDDGLPSSIEELELLCANMMKEQVVPFAWAGAYQSYFNHLIGGLWAAFQGEEEARYTVTFDSGNNTSRIITGFNSDGTPQLANETINIQKGYLVYQQEGIYRALDFAEKMLTNNWFHQKSTSGSTSHLGAQTNYVFSRFEDDPIAMLIEGSYWYNEAADPIKRTENTYPKAKDRKLAWMPLPVQATGSVAVGEGKRNTVYDANSAFAFINANIKDNENKIKLAKLFLQYCYKDSSLIDFTLTTGVTKGVDYTISEDELKDLNYYAQSLYTIKKNSDILYPFADNTLFVNNQGSFSFTQSSSKWGSVPGATYGNYYAAFRAGVSAKTYFENMGITQSDWTSRYSDYFNAD